MPIPMNTLDGWMTLIIIIVCTIAVLITMFAKEPSPIKKDKTDKQDQT